MSLFGSSGRASRIAQITAQMGIEEERKRQDEIQLKLDKQHDEELALTKRQLNEQKKNNEVIKKSIKTQLDIANRPDPAPPPPAAVMVTGGTASGAEANDDTSIDARRRGRAALRIDMSAPQTGGGSTGLNVPRG